MGSAAGAANSFLSGGIQKGAPLRKADTVIRTLADMIGVGGSGGAAATVAASPDADALATACQRIVDHLKNDVKVNFLALDFDMTVLEVHTGGRWGGTPEQLAQHIRPFFRLLIPMAVEAGIFVAIVTFSPQTGMIRRVLRTVFPDIAERVPIRGEDGAWEYEGVGASTGKQAHMASAVEELTLRQAATITRASTLLIDDDAKNIQFALSSQVKAVWCNPDDVGAMQRLLLAL